MATSNGDDRLDRIETAILRLTEVTEAGFAGTTQMIVALQGQMRIFDSRLTILEGQMVELVGRIRIIGEQLATHNGHG